MYERMKAPFFACIAAIAVGGIEILFGVKNPLRVSIMFLAFGVTSSIILERKQYGRIEPLQLVKRNVIFWALAMIIVYFGFKSA